MSAKGFFFGRLDLEDGGRQGFTIDSVTRGLINVSTWHGWAETPVSGSAYVLPVSSTSIRGRGVAALTGRGGYALVPPGTELLGGAGLIIHTPEYTGLSQVGGPVEAEGRLKYIDGCSDSLLICPALVGEPCLNLLHLPAGTHQTQHTHPSERIGIIIGGAGVCVTADQRVALTPGMFWYIPPETEHSFHTEAESLDVLAWHPDSDFGPSHDQHPMINRTIVEGVAANDPKHAGIRTT